MAVSHTLVVAAVLISLLVCVRADLCAPDCRGGSDFFPHPQDCNSYYRCSHGTAFLRHCPEGLEFAFPGNLCDYPAQARCTSDPANECGVADPPQELSTTEADPITPTCAPKCLFIGPYLAHPQDCSKFYICGGDGPVEFSCQKGLLYNKEELRCDYPDNFTCAAGPHRACDEIL